MADLLCPKDQVSMRSVERNGVTIERCPECGGLFLDRGEFERLASFEAEAALAPAREVEPFYGDERGRYSDDPRQSYGKHGGGGGHHGGQGGPRRQRRGFLSNFLDFD